MSRRKRPPTTHEHLMQMIIMVLNVTIVLTLTAGIYFWITHRDWLLIALGAWGGLTLLVIISADKRHTQDDS